MIKVVKKFLLFIMKFQQLLKVIAYLVKGHFFTVKLVSQDQFHFVSLTSSNITGFIFILPLHQDSYLKVKIYF